MADFVEDEIPTVTGTVVTVAGKDVALFNVDGTIYANVTSVTPTFDTSTDTGFLREKFSRPKWSVVGCDDRASLNLSVVKEVVRLGRPLEREVFDQHLDFSRLGETDHFDQLGDVAPVG
jgi:hypothetical protein